MFCRLQGVCQHRLFDALHNAGCINTVCLLCRLQQVRSLWSEIPHIQKAVEKLSKECMDLLNRIFVVDDKKRITIEAIKEHPWSAFSPFLFIQLHSPLYTHIRPFLLPVCLRLASCDLILLRLSSFVLL